MNIGDNVSYNNEYGEKIRGVISNVHSDMDSYDEMRLENGVPLYYSKKLSRFVPVKPKNMATVFLEIDRGPNSWPDFIGFNKACAK